MSERACPSVRRELSSLLDNETPGIPREELDVHLRACSGCRSYARELRRIRGALRIRSADAVPDLVEPIMRRVQDVHQVGSPPGPWSERVRAAVAAAVAAAILVLGVATPWGDGPADMAGASDIARGVRAAARQSSTYRASLVITERGWHPELPIRRFRADLWFSAPERFRLRIRDLTDYPRSEGWVRNDLDLVASAARWWMKEPASCPVEALPGCTVDARDEERALRNRQPFDGTSPVPTDIVVPLETLAAAGSFTVTGRDTVLGRSTYVVTLPYRYAQPLVRALQPGGAWRSFEPRDEVRLWLDEETWFPLRFEVHDPADGAAPALAVRVTSLEEPSRLPGALFIPPRTGRSFDAGFRPLPAGAVGGSVPAYSGGLPPYRAGRIGERSVRTYASGLNWLKVIQGPPQERGPEEAEPIQLDRGIVYYRPADETLRGRIDIFGKTEHVSLQSNLPRAKLLAVASSMNLQGERVEPSLRTGSNALEALRARPGYDHVLVPAFLPIGYDRSLPLFGATRARSVTLHYRHPEIEYDGSGIRIVQEPSAGLLPPPSGDFETARLGRSIARWSAERGELEWIEEGVYRSVAAPSFDLATVLRIAASLR